jgi:hypothetical protein
VEHELGGELFVPDLRGDLARVQKRDRRRAEDEARALLAVLVDLPGKEAVAARIKKRLAASAVAAIVVVLMAGGMVGAWVRWLETAEGRFHRALHSVLQAANTESVVDRALVRTASSLGRLGDIEAVEGLSRLIPDSDLRAVTLAAGYASLSAPDCASAQRALKDADAVVTHKWPEGHLLFSDRCRTGPGTPALLLSVPDRQKTAWIRTAVRAGHSEQARAWLQDGTVARAARLEIVVDIGIVTGMPVQYTPDDVQAWVSDDDIRTAPHVVVIALLDLF